MRQRWTPCVLLGSMLMASLALGQTYPPPGVQPSNGGVAPARPDQPVQSQPPTLMRRPAQAAGQTPAAPQELPVPFVITPQEQAQVDRALQLWEQRNIAIKRFDCKFKRWTYSAVFGKPDQPLYVDVGEIKYGAPDRGLFHVQQTEKDGKLVEIEGLRAEHWLSDGKSIYQYKHAEKKVVEYKVPPELQGKEIAKTPLPFLFNSKAEELKRRYFIHLIPPPPGMNGKICLEAYPRLQTDAADFHHAQFMIDPQDMLPQALKLFDTNGKDSKVFSFFKIDVNPADIFNNPFRASTPWGWQKVPGEQPAQQSRRVPDARRPTW